MGKDEHSGGNIMPPSAPPTTAGKRKAPEGPPLPPQKMRRLGSSSAAQQNRFDARGPGIDELLVVTASDLENGNLLKIEANLRAFEKNPRTRLLMRNSPLDDLNASLNQNIHTANELCSQMEDAATAISSGNASSQRASDMGQRNVMWTLFLSATAAAKLLTKDKQMRVVSTLQKSGSLEERALHACNACEYLDDFKAEPRSRLLQLAITFFPYAKGEVAERMYEHLARARHENYLEEKHFRAIDLAGKRLFNRSETNEPASFRNHLEATAKSFQDDVDASGGKKKSAALMHTSPLFPEVKHDVDPMGRFAKARADLIDVVRHFERGR